MTSAVSLVTVHAPPNPPPSPRAPRWLSSRPGDRARNLSGISPRVRTEMPRGARATSPQVSEVPRRGLNRTEKVLLRTHPGWGRKKAVVPRLLPMPTPSSPRKYEQLSRLAGLARGGRRRPLESRGEKAEVVFVAWRNVCSPNFALPPAWQIYLPVI